MDLEAEGTIGNLTVRNRGVFRAVRTRLVDDGIPTDDLAAHLAARAEGGAGLIVGPAQMLVYPSTTGSEIVDPAQMLVPPSTGRPAFVDAYDSDTVPGLTRVVDAVHDRDARIIGQLTHTGAEATGDWDMQEQLAPSASPSDAAYEMPKTMTQADIDEIVDGFAHAADNLDTAGFDGVELAAGPFSVLRQFLSPRYNVREDAYGGDWDARAAFVNEALSAVSDHASGPVGLHLSLAELEYGGYGFEDVPEILDAVEGFDYLSCTVGTASTYNQTHASVSVTQPDLLESIQTAADAVDVPVMGRLPLTTVEDVDTLFEVGVDFVSFTRQLLADEETLARIRDGERYDRCIQCNQKCLEAVYGHAHGGHVECVVNPRTGRENSLPARSNLEPAALPQAVLVVGGGAAGLRFAAIAAIRGHDVTLREASDELGGQLGLAAQGPLEPLSRAAEDLKAAARDAGVDVELESPVTAEEVDASWDAVVVATGAKPPDTSAYEFDGEVVDAFDVLEGTEVDGDVLLFDENRWVITMQVGLTLLEQAESVEMVASDHYPGFRTEQPNLPGFVAALQAQGAEFTGNHTVDAVAEDGTVTLRNTLTGDSTHRDPDTVVVAGRRQADEELYLELDERRDDVYRIGDAVSPRKLDRAYYDGELLARRL